ncbi:MAG: Methyltransferase type 11 [Myxococcales bacterium]|nr:Methyltransferase type 11 [Myxococcales bacterium]
MTSTTDRCRLCGSSVHELFSGTIMSRHHVRYFDCARCGLLQTEKPHWLDEAYAAPINSSDTGILQRNLVLSRITAAVINVFFNRRAKFLDYAGGFGIFVRLMRDRGFDFYWEDPHAPNLLARSFDRGRLGAHQVELVTSFESFEHFVDPVAELDRMLSQTETILLSTLLAPETAPGLDRWWYYGTEHGQHISFYRARTLRHLAAQRGLYVCTNGRNVHLLSRKPIAGWRFNLAVASAYIGLSEVLRPLTRSRTLSDATDLGSK